MRRLPWIVFAVLAAAELAAVLVTNDGFFTYTLDDPYIHLALAENVARGHYGLNLGETSAPSSSILWPFLLAPFARLPGAVWVPLALNLLLAAAVIAVFARHADRAVGTARVLATTVAVLLVPASNLVGLVFTGMEHVAQLLAAALVVLGLVRELDRGEVAWWLSAALVLGPLVRYENLALTVPALVFLALRGHVRAAFLAGFSTTLGLAGFSSFLDSKGLGGLPSSVFLKSSVVSSGGALGGLASNVFLNLSDQQGILLLISFFSLALFSLHRQNAGKERLFAAALAGGVVLHLLAGRIGWYHRYEIYVWTAVLLAHLHLYRGVLLRARAGRREALLVLFVGAVAWQYVGVYFTVPFAANNVYEQHYQMHRFAADFYRAPIAANDVGYVSFQNDEYVLDLFGLASREVLLARAEGRDPEWLNGLAARHGVRAAMMYDLFILPRPASWVPVAELRLSRRKVSPMARAVRFYAVDEAEREHLADVVRQFAKTLPEGVGLEML